jgi:5-methylcytosine-specific restriction endonuclease McrA
MTKRRYISKLQIVNYWVNWQKENRKLPPFGDFDIGEPACMACGYWEEDWDLWNKTAGLEKCHIVAICMGGVDDVSNMVVMCERCHKQHPYKRDPEATYNYMILRKNAWITERISFATLMNCVKDL